MRKTAINCGLLLMLLLLFASPAIAQESIDWAGGASRSKESPVFINFISSPLGQALVASFTLQAGELSGDASARSALTGTVCTLNSHHRSLAKFI